MKPKRLGRGLKGLIKSSDPETLPPERKNVPPRVKPTIAPPARKPRPADAEGAEPMSPPQAAPSTPTADAPGVKTPETPAPKADAAPAAAPAPAAPAAEATPAPAVVPTPADAPVAKAPPSDRVSPPSATPAEKPSPDAGTSVRQIPVGEVRPNPYQPRTSFGEEDLDELKASIAEHGVLQPIVVRPAAVGFELIAGERRLRATTALGHAAIPAIVRRAADEEMQTLALVENLQRVDLNALEKAKALKAMMRNFGLTQEEVATKVGKARTSISNLVRLLELPVVIQDLVSEGHLSGSQARAVLLAHGIDRRIALARRAVKQGLTVRQIERLAKAERSGGTKDDAPDPYVADLEGRLREALGTRVQLKPRGKGGSIVIGYHDASELDRLLETFGAS